MRLEKYNNSVIVKLDSCSNTTVYAVKVDNKWEVLTYLQNTSMTEQLIRLINKEEISSIKLHINSAKTAIKCLQRLNLEYTILDHRESVDMWANVKKFKS